MSHNFCIVWSLFALLMQFRFNEVIAIECGTVDFVDPKISSGTVTVKGAWPFVAALYYVDQSAFFCAGTLITAKNVLTGALKHIFKHFSYIKKSQYFIAAAHCVHQKYPLKNLAPEGLPKHFLFF